MVPVLALEFRMRDEGVRNAFNAGRTCLADGNVLSSEFSLKVSETFAQPAPAMFPPPEHTNRKD